MVSMITGGARSGKSSFAEGLYEDLDDVVYIATAKVEDHEMGDRIRLHRKSRPGSWRTFEGYKDLIGSLGKEEHYILDCITVMTSNIMFEMTQDMERIDLEIQKQVEDRICSEVENLIREIRDRGYSLAIVTNEVGLSLVPEHHVSRVFRDIQGRINQRIGELSDQVYLVVAGIPVKIK